MDQVVEMIEQTFSQLDALIDGPHIDDQGDGVKYPPPEILRREQPGRHWEMT